jgi:uncharacterized membrane protein YecN with MAPEG domain
MLPVTLVFAGAAALINLWLAFRVVAIRNKAKVLHGDGDNPLLLCRMRAQANFVEYAPFVLILMGLVELAGGSKSWLWGIGAVFTLARLSHMLGMDAQKLNVLRAVGACVTWAVLLVLAVWAIWMGSHPPAPVHYL